MATSIVVAEVNVYAINNAANLRIYDLYRGCGLYSGAAYIPENAVTDVALYIHVYMRVYNVFAFVLHLHYRYMLCL